MDKGASISSSDSEKIFSFWDGIGDDISSRNFTPVTFGVASSVHCITDVNMSEN